MHDGMPYGRNQGQGQGHSREVDRQSPTGLIFLISGREFSSSSLPVRIDEENARPHFKIWDLCPNPIMHYINNQVRRVALSTECIRAIVQRNEMTKPGIRRVCIRDVPGNGIPNGTRNPIGMGIKHRFGNGNGREWDTTSVGIGITCTPMGIYSQRFYAAMCRVCRLPKCNLFCPSCGSVHSDNK